jgi:ABC-type Fe3+/spermidine/putrescine transport system ATPase subunit
MLEVIGVTHRYGGTTALDRVTVRAAASEFLTILGESGSGKTTLLRIISGLERPSEVEALKIAGQDVRHVTAAARNCTTVFQHYALFPHMSVGENVAYGLRVRGVPPRERQERAGEALKLVRLGDKTDRRVHQLSGGERQRVALARALVTRPAILLLDEPLGALDEKLRLDMQIELMELHRRLGVTFVYITHSQEEALTMSDRVILMRRGRIEQEGPPRALFDHPASRFVAEFMGVENLIEGVLEEASGPWATVRVGGRPIRGRWAGAAAPRPGQPACVAVRAERVRIGGEGALAGLPNRFSCQPKGAVYKGKYLDQVLDAEIGTIKVRLWDGERAAEGITRTGWAESDCTVMPA